MIRRIIIRCLILLLLLLAEMYWGPWKILSVIWGAAAEFIGSLDDRVLAGLVTGALVAFGAIYAKYMENRYSVEAQFRNKKIKLFNEFVEILQGLPKSDTRLREDELVRVFTRWKREMLFRSSPEVMQNFLAIGGMSQNIKTVSDLSKPLELMGNLILSMRKDIGLSNRNIVPKRFGVSTGIVFGARFQLKDPELFLSALRRRPTTKISDLENDPNIRKSLQ